MNRFLVYDLAIKDCKNKIDKYNKKIEKLTEATKGRNLDLNYIYNSSEYPVDTENKKLLGNIANHLTFLYNVGVLKNNCKGIEENILLFSTVKKVLSTTDKDLQAKIMKEYSVDQVLINFDNIIKNDLGYIDIPHSLTKELSIFQKETEEQRLAIFKALTERAQMIIDKEPNEFEKMRFKNNSTLLLEYLKRVLLDNEPILSTYNHVYEDSREYNFLLRQAWFVKHETLYHAKVKVLNKINNLK